jgi:hypothetical protein
MSRPSLANTLLFWFMLILGTAGLAPCLALPAWLERQAQIECLRAREIYLAGLQQRLVTVRKQIEHLNDDPAYIIRLAEEDFGRAIKVPDVETIWIHPRRLPRPRPLKPTSFGRSWTPSSTPPCTGIPKPSSFSTAGRGPGSWAPAGD